MPDVDHLRARLQHAKQELQEIHAELARAEQESETPGQQAVPAAERAAKRWGLAAAIGLLSVGLWALTRTGGQYATAGLLMTAAVVGAAILLAPEPSPPLPGGLPTTEPSSTASSTSATSTSTALTLPSTPGTPPAKTTQPDTAPPPGTPAADTPTPTSGQVTEPPDASPQPVDRDEDETGRSDEGSNGDDEGSDDDGRRARCLNVPPRPVVDINACLSPVGEMASLDGT
jgi:hypothetical protein